MPLTIRPLTATDLPAVVKIQYSAFHPTERMHMLFYPSPQPPTPIIYERTVARHLSGFGKEGVEWVKVVDDSGVIVAAARWVFYPTSDSSRWGGPVDPSWILAEDRGLGNCGLGVEDKDYVSWVVGKNYENRKSKFTGPGAWLDICFTDPVWKGKGAGKMLVNWGTEKADGLGVRCFVEASAEGVPLYERCGFVIKDEVVLEGGKERDDWREYGAVRYTWMERDVRIDSSK